MNKKCSLFIGRWQGIHDGHRWLWNQELKKGKDILIAIQDVSLDDTDEENEYIAEEVMGHLAEEFRDEILEGRVKLMIIPAIESVNYGRTVGYDIVEHKPPEHIRKIKGRELRKENDTTV
jgi:nicotinamide mononucleotide adenylyltransferase|tara:strand:- start:491 stop:850 length:360 start_codon:yes stop_codon:yes gene_type:complete